MLRPGVPVLGRFLCLVAAIAALSLPRPGQALDLTHSETTVVAHEGDTPLWTRDHNGVDADDVGVIDPVVVGDAVIYAAGPWLFVVDARSGVVQRSIPLPSVPSSVRADGDAAVVELSATAPVAWTRTYRIDAESAVPLVLPTDAGGRQLAREADAVLRSFAALDGAALPDDIDDVIAGLVRMNRTDDAIAVLAAAAAADPTNPWLPALTANLLARAYRTDEARAALTSIGEVPPELAPQLLLLHAEITGPWAAEYRPELDAIRDAGVRGLLRAGYAPSMARSTAIVPLFAGTVPDVDDLDLNAVVARAELIWDIAPWAEGAAFHYRAVAAALERDGQTAMAPQWRQRAEQALPRARRDQMSAAALETGEWLNAAKMLSLALLLAFGVRYLRYAVPTWQSDVPAWRRLTVASMTRLELVGLLVLLAGAWHAWDRANADRDVLLAILDAPAPVLAGNPGAPEAAAWWAQAADDPDGRYLYAWSLAAGHQYDEASALFEQLGDAASTNNLGVIAAARGDALRGRMLFERALDADPALPRPSWNLGQPVEAPELDPFARWTSGQLVLAAPDDARLEAAWAAMARARSSASGPVAAQWGLLAIGMLCLIGLVLPRPPVDEQHRSPVSELGWGLGWLVPGSARQFGPIGPPLLGAFVVSLSIFITVQTSQGAYTNPADAVLVPDARALYGIYARTALPQDLVWARLGNVWIGLFMLNLIVVAVAERFIPDPVGPNLSIIGGGRDR